MQQRLKQELMMFARKFVEGLWYLPFGSYPPKWLMVKMGELPLVAHIKTERAKMWKPYGGEKSLWQWVVKHSDTICYLCRKAINEGDVIEVDHRTSLWHFGASVPANLAVTHRACNQRKGWRNEAEYRRRYTA